MKRAISLFLVLFFFGMPLLIHAQQTSSVAHVTFAADPKASSSADTFIRKDPILAGALSWYVPGLGQFYSGAYLKGAVFLVVEKALLVGTVLTFAELRPSVTGGISLGLNIRSKDDPDRDEQRVAVVLGVSLVIVHFINVIDAVNSARAYNRKITQKIYGDVGYDKTTKAYRAGLSAPF